MHRCEHGDIEAEPARIQQSAIAQDVTGFLQRAHPAQARRRRNADPPGQLDVGNSAVSLDFSENFEVDLVKVLRHAGSGPEQTMRNTGNTLSAGAGASAILLRVRRIIFAEREEKSRIWIAILA